MSEVEQAWDEIRYYYDDTSHILFDVNNGIFRYDYNSHTLAFVLPLQMHERRQLACFFKYQGMKVTLASLLQDARDEMISDYATDIPVCKLRQALSLLDSERRFQKAEGGARCAALSHNVGLLPVVSLEFFLASLRWSLQGNASN